MWTIKRFRTKEAMTKWIARHGHRYQWQEVFLDNAFGVECRKLRRIL